MQVITCIYLWLIFQLFPDLFVYYEKCSHEYFDKSCIVCIAAFLFLLAVWLQKEFLVMWQKRYSVSTILGPREIMLLWSPYASVDSHAKYPVIIISKFVHVLLSLQTKTWFCSYWSTMFLLNVCRTRARIQHNTIQYAI